MKSLLKEIISTAKVVALALVFSFAVSVAFAEWTGPSAPPPGGNTPAPLNVGGSHQEKLGSVSINTTTSNPDQYGLDVFGISRFFGNLEVGVASAPATVKIVDGNQAEGKVLTSNASGLARWATPSGGGTAGSCDTSPFQVMSQNTVYQNTSSAQLIVIAYSYNVSSTDLSGSIGSSSGSFVVVAIDTGTGNPPARRSITFVVPPGYYYKVSDINASAGFKAEAWKICAGGSGGGTSGVSKIIAGPNITVSPTGGAGEVTVSGTGGGGVAGVSQIVAGSGVSISPSGGTGVVTVNATGAGSGISKVTAGKAIHVEPGAAGEVIITNMGVTRIIPGNNITIDSGIGDLRIDATTIDKIVCSATVDPSGGSTWLVYEYTSSQCGGPVTLPNSSYRCSLVGYRHPTYNHPITPSPVIEIIQPTNAGPYGPRIGYYSATSLVVSILCVK